MDSQRQVQFASPSSIVFPRKFDTALRSSYAINFKNRIRDRRLTNDDRLLTRSPYCYDIEESKTTGELHSQILNKILIDSKSSHQYVSTSQLDTRVIHTVITENIMLQWEHMHRNNHLPNVTNTQDGLLHLLTKKPFTILEKNLIWYAAALEEIVTKLNKIHASNVVKLPILERQEQQLRMNHAKIDELDLSFVWSSRLCWIAFGNTHWLFPREYIIMMHNKICDLLSILMLLKFQVGVAYEENAMDIFIKFLIEMTRLHLQYREDFFHIAKALEAICIGETLIVCDSWDNNEFLNVLVQSLKEKVGYKYYGSPLQRLIVSSTIPFRHELACCSKLFGHPMVDIKGGVMDLHSKTTTAAEIDLALVYDSVNLAKLQYIRNHICRHKTWPPCEFEGDIIHKGLIWAKLHNKDPLAKSLIERFGKITSNDMACITLLPNMEFDELENYIPYIKDKTITVLKDRLLATILKAYDKEDPDSKPQRPKWAETRLLLAFLLAPDIMLAHKKYITKYAKSADLTDLANYLVIRVVPKEKELKVMFRGFGCKTYEDRARALAQEKNAMRYLDEYADDQAMTLSELDLAKKLFAFRTLLKAYPGFTRINILVDSSNWNNRQRHECVEPIATQILDQVFDTTVFGKTHQAYKKTMFYVEDEEVVYQWDGQSGGIEGLNQDTWVIVYIHQIRTAMQEFEYPYYVLCRGDDLRIVVLIPPEVLQVENLSEIKNLIVSRVSETMKGFGHLIKVDDSYGSETYFAFSKTASIDTIELPQTFRKIQKAYGANNAFIQTLDEYIGSTFSNAHSACKVGVSCVAPYVVALFWSIFYLLRTPEFADLGPATLTGLLLIPSIVGGFPIIYLHNMYVRAESDLLSPFISLCHFVDERRPDIAKIMRNFLQYEIGQPKTYTGLWQDPYSVRVGRPLLPTSLLRMIIARKIIQVCRNTEILKLIELKNSKSGKSLVECLESAEPCNVKVLSNVYAATPEGIFQELVRKFESGRSVMELLILRVGRRNTDKILRQIVAAEVRLQRWRKRKIQGVRQRKTLAFVIDDYACPAEAASAYREESWGRKIEGVTMPPLQHQLYFVTEAQALNDPWAQHNHFTYYIYPTTKKIEEDSSRHWASSEKKPFLGYTTRTGMIEPAIHFIKNDPILTKMKNLLDLVPWTLRRSVTQAGNTRESNLVQLIEILLELFTDTPLRELSPFAGEVKAGTIKHHLRSASFRESIVPNLLSNIYQQIVGETNSHRTLRQLGSHFSLNFLHVYCYAVTVAFSELEFAEDISTPPIVWAVTSACPCSTTPIIEEPIRIDEDTLINVKIPKLSATRVAKASEEILTESLRKFRDDEFNLIPGDDMMDFEIACIGILEEICEHTGSRFIRIMDRYIHHRLTDEGMDVLTSIAPNSRSRAIGLTELKRIPTKFISEYLLMFARWYLDIHLSIESTRSAEAQFVSVDGRTLPWYGLLQQLYRISRLPEVLRNISVLSGIPSPVSYNSPASAAHYVGLVVISRLTQPFAIPKIVFCTYYQDADIYQAIRTRFCSIQRLIYHRHFHEYFQLHWDPKEPNKIMPLLHQLLLIASIDPMSEEVTAEIKRTIIDNQEQIINMFQFTNVDVYKIMSYVDDPTTAPPFLRYLLRLHSRFPWEDASNQLEGTLGITAMSCRTLCLPYEFMTYWTNLTQCIEIVRSSEYELEQEEVPADALLIHDNVELRVSYNINPDRSMVQVDNAYVDRLLPYPDFDAMSFHTDKIILNPSPYRRPYGVGTTSQNKLIECMAAIGIVPPLPDFLVAATLGEGFGGITELIASGSKHSVILFNTLPPDTSVDTRPWIAEAVAEQNDVTILADHISTGYYDLCKVSTFLYYEDLHHLRYHIVTCDAEVIDDDTILRKQLLLNVVRFYLRNRTKDGVLFLKFNCKETRHILTAIAELQGRVRKIFLKRCTSSTPGGESYLIAYGVNNPETPSYADNIRRISVRGQRAYEQFRRRVHNQYQQLLVRKPRKVFFGNGKMINTILLQWFKLLQPSWNGKLSHNTGVSINSNLITGLRTIDDLNLLTRDIIEECKLASGTQLARIVSYKSPDLVHVAWDTDTRTHMFRVGERWCALQGFIYIVTQYHDYNRFTIDENHLRQYYTDVIHRLPHRLGWLPVRSAQYRKSYQVDGILCSPYEAYMKGCAIGLMFLSHNNLLTQELLGD